MDRNITLTVIFTVVLVVSLFTQSTSVKAESSEHITFSSGLTVYSPVNRTYNVNLLTLNLTFGSGAGLQRSLNYSIDGKYQGPIHLTFNGAVGFELVGLGYGLVQLPELSNGPHVLTVNVEAYLNDYYGNPPGAPFKPVAPNSSDYVASWIHTIYFTVNASEVISTPTTSSPSETSSILEPLVSFTRWHTSSQVIQPPANRLADIPPIVEIISPKNQTTLQTSSLTLTVDVASYFWIIDSVYYQADWQDGSHKIFGIQPNYVDALNATIIATFTQIPNGNHTVEIYANTHDNMHTLSTVIFSVQNTNPSSTPTPTLLEFSWLIILPLFVLMLAIAVIVRLRKTWKVT